MCVIEVTLFLDNTQYQFLTTFKNIEHLSELRIRSSAWLEHWPFTCNFLWKESGERNPLHNESQVSWVQIPSGPLFWNSNFFLLKIQDKVVVKKSRV